MRESPATKILIYFFLLLFAAFYVVPLFWTFITSVKHPGMVFDGRWLPYERKEVLIIDGKEQEIRIVEERDNTFLVKLAATNELREIPRSKIESISPNWNNYVETWQIVPFGRFFLNSILVTASITVGQLITCSLGGFAFSRLRFPGRDKVFFLYLATLMIPGTILTIPIYLLLRSYHLLDTYQGVILPGLFSAYGTFLLRQFFMTIPTDLEDAARIDGAGSFSVYLRIILPLSGPALAALATFVFIGSWNDFFWPSIVLTDPSRLTLPVGLALFNDLYLLEYGRLMAGSMISIIPAILMYLVFQKFITQGIVMTGLKG
jgi:multiple sugar transport system permease protein